MTFDNRQSFAADRPEGKSSDRGSCRSDGIDRVSLYEDFGKVKSGSQAKENACFQKSELDFGSAKDLFGGVSKELNKPGQTQTEDTRSDRRPDGAKAESSDSEDRFSASRKWIRDRVSAGDSREDESGSVISDMSEIGDRFTTSTRWTPNLQNRSEKNSPDFLDMGSSSDLYSRQLFDQLDLNGSGGLSKRELRQGVVNDLLRQDKNDDGRLDRREAIEGAKERGTSPFLAELGFHFADRNRNGELDSREMRRMAKGVADLTMLFGDRDRDGRLSYDEFRPLVPDRPPVPPQPRPDVPPQPRPDVPPQPRPDVPPQPQPDVPPQPRPDVPPQPRPDVPPEPQPDVPPEPQPDVPPEPKPDDTVEQAREKLLDSVDDYLTPAEAQRMQKMMAEFEERGSERVEAKVAGGQDRTSAEKEWNEKIKNTYQELDDMVNSESPGAVYDKATRAKLAENAMYLFMNPANENQGQHGTCWVESQINLIGLGKNPDKMANLLNQVATTGSYTDINGRQHKIPSQLLQISGEEARWTVSNAGNGYRSPVGAIFDRTLSYCNNGRTDGGTNGGTVQEAANAIRLACGESGKMIQIRDNYLTESDIARITSREARQAMLEDGGVILVGPGHMFSSRLVNEDGNWQIIGDNQWGSRNDQLIGELTNLNTWDVRQTRKSYVPDHGSMYIANDRTISSRSTAYSTDNFSYGNYQGQSPLADNSRIYDDTNDMIEGPLGYRRENSNEDRDGHYRRDRRFNHERYMENQRRLRDEWRRMHRS
ncbi:MAG: hypothetical protein GC193_14640 [Cryomorphaceae bacterium]|nr:hypothetical protein [Cryomorphaceae bacterium]